MRATSAPAPRLADEAPSGDRRRWNRRLLALVGLSTLARLALAASTGLGVDESYAASVARPFALSYFDHPPLHFWLVGAMITASGDTSAFVLRLPFVLCFTVTLWSIGRLGMHLFGPRAGVLGAACLACTGVLGVTSGTWVLPDGPLLMGSSVGALLAAPRFVPPLDAARAASTRRMILVGIAFAIALLSKYHAVLTVGGLFVFLLTVPAARDRLRTRAPWLALAVASVAALPVLWWNATHDWASFTFHGARAVTARAWSIAPLAENVAGQTAWLLPWIMPLAIAALVGAWRAGPGDPRRWYCAMLASGPIVGFTLITLTGARGLPHWQAPGWLFVMPLLGHLLDRTLRTGRRWPATWMRVSAVATATLALVAATHASTGWLGAHVPSLAPPADPTLDALDWRSLREALRVRGLTEHVVVGRSWIQAGKLGVALGPAARVECACDDPHHFAYRPSLPDSVPRLVVEHAQPWRRDWQPASRALADRLGPLDSLDTVVVARGTRPAISLVLYRPRAAPPPAAARSAASW